MRRWITLTTLAIAGWLISCGTPPERQTATSPPARPVVQQKKVIPVEVIEIVPTRFVETLELPGTVESLQDAKVASRVSARVLRIAPLGQKVHRGEVVVRLDDAVYKAQYELARVQYELMQDTYRRQEALFRDSVISEIEFTRAKAQLDQAKAQLDQAKTQLSFTRVKAPFDGRIETHFIEEGELAAPGSPLIRIVNNLSVNLVAGVPERYALDVTQGTPVTVRFSTYNGEEQKARVSFVSNVIDPVSRTFQIKIRLDNPAGTLKPEMVADLTLQIGVYDKAIVLPQAAILFDEEGPYVYVVESEGDSLIARRKRIKTGPTSGNLTLIREGLYPGDRVIVVGQSNLGEGDLVSIIRLHPQVTS